MYCFSINTKIYTIQQKFCILTSSREEWKNNYISKKPSLMLTKKLIIMFRLKGFLTNFFELRSHLKSSSEVASVTSLSWSTFLLLSLINFEVALVIHTERKFLHEKCLPPLLLLMVLKSEKFMLVLSKQNQSVLKKNLHQNLFWYAIT